MQSCFVYSKNHIYIDADMKKKFRTNPIMHKNYIQYFKLFLIFSFSLKTNTSNDTLFTAFNEICNTKKAYQIISILPKNQT